MGFHTVHSVVGSLSMDKVLMATRGVLGSVYVAWWGIFVES